MKTIPLFLLSFALLASQALAQGASVSAARAAVAASAANILSGAFPGQEDAVQTLTLQAPSDPNAKDDDGTTALMRAARDGQDEAVKALLSQPGLRVDEKDQMGQTALIIAAVRGRTEIVRLLLEAKADPGVVDSLGGNALLDAAQFGRTKTAGLLLAAGAEVNPRDPDGNTPLILSIRGRAETVDLVASAPGVDLNAKNAAGTTALIEASRSELDSDKLAALLNHRVDLDLAGDYKDYNNAIVQDYTALMAAAAGDNLAGLKLLVQHGAGLNHHDRVNGNTALLLSVKTGRTESVGAIASAPGADLNAKNAAGTTALIEAARSQASADKLAVLLDAGADKDLSGDYTDYAGQTTQDYTALMFAAAGNNLPGAKILVDRHANLNYRSRSDGKTALDIAKSGANQDLIDLLTAAGAQE